VPLPITPETEAVTLKVTERVLARLARGEGPPSRSIPRDKRQFPKLLCLDQNKWIDLARAHYGRKDGAAFVDALAALREAIANGRLMVPIMSSNLLEVSEPNDEDRRRRLAQFMVDTSGNHSFLKPDPVARLQIQRAIRTMYLHQDVELFPREKLVAWGVEYALGKQATGEPFLVQALLEPENSVLALVHAVDREGVAAGRQMDERAANASRIARAGGYRPERRAEELTNLFASGSFADKLYGVVDRLGIDRAVFVRWLEQHQDAFASAIPDVDVQVRLMLARDRNEQHATHRNDLKDFIFLSVAVPYGNVVVTENSWTHLIQADGMDQQYGTIVLSDVRALPDVLARENCIGAPATD
jgi:hypothetical protein